MPLPVMVVKTLPSRIDGEIVGTFILRELRQCLDASTIPVRDPSAAIVRKVKRDPAESRSPKSR